MKILKQLVLVNVLFLVQFYAFSASASPGYMRVRSPSKRNSRSRRPRPTSGALPQSIARLPRVMRYGCRRAVGPNCS